MKLEPKERRFVSEFLVDQNGTQAVIRAGYSKKTARQIATRLLSKVHIQDAINKSLREVEEANQLSAARIDASLIAIAEADIRKAFNADGTAKSMTDIPDDVAKAISGVDVDEDGNVLKFKFADKVKPLEILLKRQRLLTDIHEHTGKDGKPLPPAVAIDLSKIPLSVLEKIAGMQDAERK